MHGENLLNTSSHIVTSPVAAHSPRWLSRSGERLSSETTQPTSQPGTSPDRLSRRPDMGKRRQVARTLTSLSNYLGNASHEQFDMSDFRRGRAQDFPEIPGEIHRNRDLPQIREQYNRPGSFTGSVASGIGGRDRSATPSARSPTTPRTSTFPVRPGSFELPNSPTSASGGLPRGRQRQRGNTLEVPSAIHYGHTQNNKSKPSIPLNITIPSSPAIVVSSEQGTQSPVHTPTSNVLPPLSPREESLTRRTSSPPPSSP